MSSALFAPLRGKIIAAVQGFAGQGEAFSFAAMKCNAPVALGNGQVGADKRADGRCNSPAVCCNTPMNTG